MKQADPTQSVPERSPDAERHDPAPDARPSRDPARLAAAGVLACPFDGVELLSAEGRVRAINARGVELYALATPGDASGADFIARFPPDTREAMRDILRAAHAGTPSRTEVRCVLPGPEPGGGPRWLEITVRSVQLAEGEPLSLVATSRDVTDAVEARSSPREDWRTARRILHATPNMLWTARPDGELDWVNEPMLAFTGSSLAELAGRPWTAMVHPDDAANVGERWSRAVRAGARLDVEARVRGADGSTRWQLVGAAPVRSGAGAMTGWVGTFTDIEAQKAAAEALARDNEQLEQDVFTQLHELKRSQSRLQAYFDACPETLTLMRLSKDGGLTYEDLNPAAVALEGLARSAVVGRRPVDIVGAELAAEMEARVKRCLQTGRATSHVVERHRADGATLHIQVVGAPLEYFDEEEGLVLFCGRDITEQRRVEDALRQSQKMEAVGQLTGGLAHDFNNLLTGITGSLDLLQARVATGRYDAVGRYVTAAQSAAGRAAALTHRLLAFSRRQTLDPKPIDANVLVAGMEDLVKRTVGPAIAVDVVAANDLWTVLVDPSQLENALLNLCINARDAMPDGGRIVIETSNSSLRERDASDAAGGDLPGGDYVTVSVIDDGVGMTPQVVERIFDPFFTTKPIGMGTGLGLSMIYGFARQSGGQVRVQSTVGAGTAMRVLLPRHLGEAEDVEAASDLSAAPRSGAGETVLIVDDEPTIRMLVSEVLEDLGYVALQAVDGQAGLKLLQSKERIDLLVTDVGLPGGMNGRQVAESGRALRPDLKVLFITGYAENAVLNQGHLERGMQVLTKPFAMEALASRIKSLIEA